MAEPSFKRDSVILSDKVKKGNVSQTEEEEDSLGAADKMRLIVAEMILEQLTGEKVELKISMLRLGKNAMDTLKNNTPDPIVQREGWSVEYDLHVSYSESEKMSFDAEFDIRNSIHHYTGLRRQRFSSFTLPTRSGYGYPLSTKEYTRYAIPTFLTSRTRLSKTDDTMILIRDEKAKRVNN